MAEGLDKPMQEGSCSPKSLLSVIEAKDGNVSSYPAAWKWTDHNSSSRRAMTERGLPVATEQSL
jgi:hypothetical protein